MSDVPHNPDGQPLTVDQAFVNINQTADPGLRYYAAWWLGKMRIRQPKAIDALLLALEMKLIARQTVVIPYDVMRSRLWEKLAKAMTGWWLP